MALLVPGGRARVRTAARYAYGASGDAPRVPPDTALEYELHLLAVRSAPELESLDDDALVAMALAKKERGNAMFKRGAFEAAALLYERALKTLEHVQGATDEARALRVATLNNLANTQERLERLHAALETCNRTLDLDASNVVALFRKGRVVARPATSRGAGILRRALKLAPENAAVRRLYEEVQVGATALAETERALYSKMLHGLDYSDVKTAILEHSDASDAGAAAPCVHAGGATCRLRSCAAARCRSVGVAARRTIANSAAWCVREACSGGRVAERR